MNAITNFVKKEIVFSIACLLAVVSCFAVKPSTDYISYIDFRTLSLLLALMLVVQGFKSCGLFDYLVNALIKKVKNKRQLAFMLVMLCFFSGMIITNDVALITFIPFSVALLSYVNDSRYSIYIIVLETIAANLGSMFTPIGNPQNLYLFSLSAMSIDEFLRLMLPYTALSFVLLAAGALLIKPVPLTDVRHTSAESVTFSIKQFFLYVLLFCICLSTVLSLLDYKIMLAIVLICVIFFNRSLIIRADYILLLTFIAFFIFIGNMKNIPEVNHLLSTLVAGRECGISILSSQLISNVPAAMLLSGFTTGIKELIIGCNLGGLGTIIASMASLISFKFYGKMPDGSTGKYMLCFSIMNILFLIILFVMYIIIN